MSQSWLLITFAVVAIVLLALDLGVIRRRGGSPSIREALLWSGVWIALSLAFNLAIYFWRGAEPALQFLTGYLIEKSLSVDNILVFAVVFRQLCTPPEYQHRVLYWGIWGAVLMRGILIVLGASLLETFGWVTYIFGAFLVYTGVRMATEHAPELAPTENPLVTYFARHVPLTSEYVDGRFFVQRLGRTMATPLFLTLIAIESSDLLFAVDSIPAIFAVTRDPFIVFTSNVAAILGLRSLYFVVAAGVDRLPYLTVGLGIVLVFVGAKMLLAPVYEIPTGVSLLTTVVVLVGATVLSLLRTRQPAPSNQRQR